jgi:hypothetical protein
VVDQANKAGAYHVQQVNVVDDSPPGTIQNVLVEIL